MAREKSQLNLDDDVLEEYGVTKFEIALNLYFHESTCAKAEQKWDYDVWEFCPVCGSRPSDKGIVLHNFYRQKAMLV